MRTIGTILLLLLIGYTQWGYDVQFIIRQWQMKEAARETWIASLPDEAFLRVSLAEIATHGKWEVAGKECWYQGHLFDIIRERSAGDSTWLFCLDDDNEERLIRQSGEVTRANLDHPDKQTNHSLSFAIGDLVCETAHWRILPLPAAPRNYCAGACERLPNRYTEIQAPPPKG
ncbi:MAG TPA: hypothetical protein VNW04_05300 [Puia sp.]|jgi:hypothetical protein|nr:hypothetical protein [Puia sp.]